VLPSGKGCREQDRRKKKKKGCFFFESTMAPCGGAGEIVKGEGQPFVEEVSMQIDLCSTAGFGKKGSPCRGTGGKAKQHRRKDAPWLPSIRVFCFVEKVKKVLEQEGKKEGGAAHAQP